MNTISPSEWLTLRGGFAVPTVAIVLALELADLGWEMRKQADGLLLSKRSVTGAQQSATPLTIEQRGQVKTLKKHLLAVVDYLDTTMD